MTDLETIVADQTQEDMAGLRRRIFELSKDRTYEQMVQGDKINALNREIVDLKLALSRSENLATRHKDWLFAVLKFYLEDSRKFKFTSAGVKYAEQVAEGFKIVESQGWNGE